MPTQKRSFPPKNVGRFSYLKYFRPSRFLISGRKPLQQLLRKAGGLRHPFGQLT
jgi:hypothetical protein